MVYGVIAVVGLALVGAIVFTRGQTKLSRGRIFLSIAVILVTLIGEWLVYETRHLFPSYDGLRLDNVVH